MVSVAKPWLICGYHGLTTVTILNLYLLFYIIINSLYIQCIYYIYTVYILYIYIYIIIFYFFIVKPWLIFVREVVKVDS